MAKPPPIIEMFKLSCEVAPDQLGHVIAQLLKMGLTNVNYELIDTVLAFATRTQHETKAEEFLRAWLTDHPTFVAKEAVAHFRQAGRTDGACYSALRTMVEDKTLKKLGSGNYARADVKAITAPKKTNEKTKAKTKKRLQDKYAVKNHDFILRAARRSSGHINSLRMKELFEADGRPVTSVGPALNHLLKDKQIKRVAFGEYELIGEAAKANSATSGAAQLNGAAQHG